MKPERESSPAAGLRRDGPDEHTVHEEEHGTQQQELREASAQTFEVKG